jgi:hypothetical protein
LPDPLPRALRVDALQLLDGGAVDAVLLIEDGAHGL